MSRDIVSKRALNQQASEYVVRLYSGELTAKEEQQILDWCSESDEHQSAFDAALSVWDDAASLTPKAGWRAQLEKRFYAWRYLAASVVIAVLVSMLLLHNNYPTEKTLFQAAQYYKTGIGEVSNVGLPDGSTVTLNTDTNIKVEFTPIQRELWLNRGEAFFDIAKDRSRPFIIHTDTKVVTVVGTKFNIKLSQSGFNIAVTEGIVAVQDTTKVASSAADNKPLLLEAGAVASFSKDSALITKQNTNAVEQAKSWTTGYLRFDDERLDKVIESFNRYRNRKIVIDPALVDMRISGVFKLSDGDSILNALEATLPIEIEKTEKKITLVKKY